MRARFASRVIMRWHLLIPMLLVGASSAAIAQPISRGDQPYGERWRDRDDGERWRDRDDRWRWQGDHVVQLVSPWQMTLGRDGHAWARIDRGLGGFRMIRIEGQGQPAYIDSVRLHFGNGRSRVVAVRQRLSDRNPNIIIDLPGDTRVLRAIEVFGRTRGWTRLGIVGLR